MSTSTTADEPAAGSTPRRRLVLVHAHPDDETLATGVTLARSVARGDQVTLVTCTLGERGEVLPAALRHLEGDGPALGRHRWGELRRAMAALGVRDHRLLGVPDAGRDGWETDGAGRWQDSGMTWAAPGIAVAAPDAPPQAFARAELDDPAAALADVLREVRPQVVVTYDPQGGYGHPDHVMAHRVTERAVELAAADGAEPGWRVAAVHWVAIGRSWAEQHRRQARDAERAGSLPAGLRAPGADDPFPPVVVPDDELDVVLQAPGERSRVLAALAAHETQVLVAPPWLALTNLVARPVPEQEGFRRVSGPALPRVADDLFAGLDLG